MNSVPIQFLNILIIYCFDLIFLTKLHTHSSRKVKNKQKKPQYPNSELHFPEVVVGIH